MTTRRRYSRHQRWFWRVALVAVMLVPVFSSGRAQAQWYGGWGFGFGGGPYAIGGGPTSAATVNYLNQRSLDAGNAAFAARSHPASNNVYAGNPNAYINNIRDPSFFARFDPSTRLAMEDGIARNPSPRVTPRPTPTPSPTPATAPPAPAPQPVLPLASFFTAMKTLVWPSDAPTTGDLETKRDASDAACLDVLKEQNAQGVATIASVTNARNKLIDYGRPALAYLREHSTQRVADTVHLFLLSLYESLGQAATPAKP